MLKIYFKIAWRNLVKGKVHSFINISGLSIGMAVALVIALWISDELSFDKYHQHYDRIAEVMQHQDFSGNIHTDRAIPYPLRAKLQNSYGNDFTWLVLSSWTNPHTLSYKEKILSGTGNFMEPGAAEMLTLKMLDGSRASLNDPQSILLSHALALSLFNQADPMGKIVKLDSVNLKVTGVYEDLPYNSSFRNVTFIAPWSLYTNDPEVKQSADDWNQNAYQLFALISDHANMAQVSARIKDAKLNAMGKDGSDLKPEIFLYPMSRWHLHESFENGVNTGGSVLYVWLFGIIGAFVLLLACINFMNLSTARSEKRARETGVRKVLGSSRKQLIKQFFSESLLIAFFSFALSLLLVMLTLPFFNTVADKKMTILWSSPFFWLYSLLFILITGMVAGSYPALYLSSFRPVKVLKGTLHAGRLAGIPRKILVVLQFSVSVILIIGTIVVYRQVQYAKNRPIGYNRNGLLLIRPNSTEFHDHFHALRNDLLQTGLIRDVAESGNTITRGGRTEGGFDWKGKNPSLRDEFASFAVTYDYGKVIGWQISEGRDFSPSFSTDASGLILNEAAVAYMGLKNPVGETITRGEKKYTVIGVSRNMIINSPYEPVKPTLFYINPEAGLLNIRISSRASVQEALGKIEFILKKYSPSSPFIYQFADEQYAAKFSNEQRIGTLAALFAGLAIFISCLGLFGLASFMAEQRFKEIAVRKILGASVLNLWGLLSKDFTVLVLISLFIATPVGGYFMKQWLQHYPYHPEIPWWIFVLTGLGAMLITLLTISCQSIKAARMNPVISLRTE